MSRTAFLSAASAAFLFTACLGPGTTLNPVVEPSLWERRKPDSFAYTFDQDGDSASEHYEVQASRDSVLEAWRMAGGGWRRVTENLQALSIDSLFARLEALKNAGPRSRLSVEYDTTFGYPLGIFADADSLVEGGFTAYRIRGFMTKPYVPRQPLVVPPSPWPEKKPAGTFAYRYFIGCFCFNEYSGPFSVVATRDSVLSVWRLNKAGDSTRLETAVQSYSIDSILVRFQAAVACNPDHASVTYDSTYGFPASTSIDRYLGWADDEESSRITEFRILTP